MHNITLHNIESIENRKKGNNIECLMRGKRPPSALPWTQAKTKPFKAVPSGFAESATGENLPTI